MAGRILFRDVPVGTRFDDSLGARFIKMKELWYKSSDGRYFFRNVILIASPNPNAELGSSSFYEENWTVREVSRRPEPK